MGDLTTTPVDVVIVTLVGYLLGSIPVANLVARRRDRSLDLRAVGDRNPGYWNAKETMGRRAAVPVFVGDLAKGAVAAGIGLALADPGVWGIGYVATGAAMIGHAYPVFARFRGGRSVLAWVGGALVISPVTGAIAVAAVIVTWAATRSFAIGARTGVIAYPIVQLAVDGPYRTAATGVLMTIIGLRFAQAALAERQADRGRRPNAQP